MNASYSTPEAGLPISVVERETGLGKDTLRVWEKRYGFPSPARDAKGERVYPEHQVRQLHLIRRLLDAGLRPGKVVGLDDAALQDLLLQRGMSASTQADPVFVATAVGAPESLEPLLQAVISNDATTLHAELNHAKVRLGLSPFVTQLVAPLTTAVGEAWASGRLAVHQEHLYTEVVAGVLRTAIAQLAQGAGSPSPHSPNVLLTTLPQELHGLGLLMVEAMLSLEGCYCTSLGTQTPLQDIAQAAQAHEADIVALSFSSNQSGPMVRASLSQLRLLLPAETDLWVGGDCTALYQKPIRGVVAIRELSALVQAVASWRHTRQGKASI